MTTLGFISVHSGDRTQAFVLALKAPYKLNCSEPNEQITTVDSFFVLGIESKTMVSEMNKVAWLLWSYSQPSDWNQHRNLRRDGGICLQNCNGGQPWGCTLCPALCNSRVHCDFSTMGPWESTVTSALCDLESSLWAADTQPWGLTVRSALCKLFFIQYLHETLFVKCLQYLCFCIKLPATLLVVGTYLKDRTSWWLERWLST